MTGHLRLAVPLPFAAATAATDVELKSSDGLNADVLRSNESRRAVNDDVFNANPMLTRFEQEMKTIAVINTVDLLIKF